MTSKIRTELLTFIFRTLHFRTAPRNSWHKSRGVRIIFLFKALAEKGLKPPDNRHTKHECIFQCQEHGFYISKEYLAKNIYLRDDREEINFNNQEVGRKVSL